MSMVRVRNQQRKENQVSSPEHSGGETSFLWSFIGNDWNERCVNKVWLTVSIAHDIALEEEEHDGFAFTRTRAKKARAEARLASTVEEHRQEERVETAPTRKPKKKAPGSPVAAHVEDGEQPTRRRSTRHSGEHENEDPPALPVKKRRKDRASSELKPKHDGGGSHVDNGRARQEPQQDHTQPIEVTFDATKIALPFADTPIIRRNKEMRKTNATRRSSLGMRGRRASSLIDSGKSNGNELTCPLTVYSLTAKKPCLMTKLIARNSTSI